MDNYKNIVLKSNLNIYFDELIKAEESLSHNLEITIFMVRSFSHSRKLPWK